MDSQSINNIVIAFPSFASYLIVALMAAGLATLVWGGKKILARLDQQDATMNLIRELLASETYKLREMQHGMEIRVTVIEERCRIVHDESFTHKRRDDSPQVVNFHP